METPVLIALVAAAFLAGVIVLQGLNVQVLGDDLFPVQPPPNEEGASLPKSEPGGEESPAEPVLPGDTGEGLDRFDYSECLSKSVSTEKNFCIRDRAIEYNDPAGCALSDSFYEDECRKRFALGVSSVGACENILGDVVRFECFSELGIQGKDASICVKIPVGVNNRLRGTCLREVAFAIGDVGVCAGINYFTLGGVIVRDSCIENFYGSLEDASLCPLVADAASKQDCIESVAKNTDSIELCVSLRDEVRADDCLLHLGTANGNSPACGSIADDAKAETCLEASLRLTPLEECYEKGTNAETNSCISGLAFSELDAELCALIETDFNARSRCYSDIAVESGNGELCHGIIRNDFELRDTCYHGSSVKSGDASFCEFIVGSSLYVDCFASVAESLGEVSVCSLPEKEVISSYSRYSVDNLCIKSFSVKRGDTSFCDRIDQEGIRTACHDLNAVFR